MIGKIEGIGSSRASTPVRRTTKTGKAEKAGFTKHLESIEEIDNVSTAAPTNAISSIEGVLGVQEIDDALAREAKGKSRANDILNRLEEIRLGILAGIISRDKLMQLSHVVSIRRPEVTNPKLGEILDEIDLRAKVELAKFGNQ